MGDLHFLSNSQIRGCSLSVQVFTRVYHLKIHTSLFDYYYYYYCK